MFVINDVIDSYSCDKIINELLYTKDKAQDVELYINSPGGDVFTGFALYNALKLYTGQVTIINTGMCASMAAFIFLAAIQKKVFKNSVLMFHKASSITYGNSGDLERVAEILSKIDLLTIDALKKYSQKTDEELEQLLINEWWLIGGKEIKENSLADEIIDINNKNEFVKISAHYRGGTEKMDEKMKAELEKKIAQLEEKVTAIQAQNQEDTKARLESILAMLKMSGIEVTEELKKAIEEGLVLLRENGIQKMLSGQTTYQEILRATWDLS
jgi:ATP-dependent Clp endopeptidase proteolytic subunit ClpP